MKQGWEIKKLGEVAHISPSKSEVKTFALNPMDMVSFLPMEDLTIGRTFVHPNKQKTLSEVEGSYTYFKEGDVLLAKVTPCFENGKLAIAKGLCNNIGFGSSEYIVIRPMQHIVNSQYLIYLLQTNTFRNGGRALMIGACGLKRLPKPYVANYELPIPSLAEQERIVEILDREFERIDALKANAEQNLQHAKDLFQSTLKQELQPKEGWKISTIGKEFKTGAGGTPNKLFKEYYEGGDVPWLRSGEVCQKYIMHTEMFITCLGVDNSSAKWFPIDTVVVAMYGATAGQVGILRIPTTTNQAICGIFPNERYIPEFVYYVMLSQKTDLVAQATGNAQPNISQVKVKGVPIPLLDVVEQRKIVNRLEKLDENCKALEENYTKTIALCDDMKQALLRKAFNGEL